MVWCDSGFESRHPPPVAEHREVRVVDAAEAGADDLADAIPLGRGREPHARIEAGGCGVGARGAAEDEVDRGEHPLVFEQLDDFDAPGRVEPPSRTTPTRPP